MRIVSLLLPLLLLSAAVYAQDQYIAKGDVFLRAAPPKPPFYRNAKELTVVRKGERVTLLGKTDVFFYEWLKIELHRDGGIVGWVYNGKKDGVPYFEKIGGN